MASYKPYVDPKSKMRELTLPAIVVGIFISIIMGAANAYLGLKAGMTVAATFPAAVMAMAVLRLFKGTILEENIARTTGAVGEALAAGAIFTIPAFIMAGVWTDFNYVTSTVLMLIGGILGVLFTTLLRRTFTDDTSLPFPESVACTEIVKAGQKGASGAGIVFGSMGVGALFQLLMNPLGIPLIGEKLKGIFTVGGAAFPYQTPAASPAFLGVGFIIGPRLGAITFSGGVFGWLFLMPLVLLIKASADESFGTHITEGLAAGNVSGLFSEFGVFYGDTIKKVAIGAMIVGAFFTLFKMRGSLVTGLVRSVKQIGAGGKGGAEEIRTERDMDAASVMASIGFLVLGMAVVYHWLTQSVSTAIVVTIVMAIAGFLFAAVAGYLVGIIGSSSNPISGLTLSTVLIAAGLLYLLDMRGAAGVAAVLGVATIVCCVAGVAGDMLQDWKVGHFLGGTPWRMQVGGLIGVIAAASVMVLPIMLLHEYGGGIGSEALPAPQAGLMATMAQGIIGGELEWGLVVIGMLFAGALILIGAPSPMLIAVGMYLPFQTTAAIFAGGIIKWILDQVLAKKEPKGNQKEAVENRGLLIASGLVAGEALLGIVLAGVAAANVRFYCAADQVQAMAADGVRCVFESPSFFGSPYLGFLTIAFLGWFMVSQSMKGLQMVKAGPSGGPPKDKDPDERKTTPDKKSAKADDKKADDKKADDDADDKKADDDADDKKADDADDKKADDADDKKADDADDKKADDADDKKADGADDDEESGDEKKEEKKDD